MGGADDDDDDVRREENYEGRTNDPVPEESGFDWSASTHHPVSSSPAAAAPAVLNSLPGSDLGKLQTRTGVVFPSVENKVIFFNSTVSPDPLTLAESTAPLVSLNPL